MDSERNRMEFAAGYVLQASALCLAILLVHWIVERAVLARRRRAVPLRICVTGTRGKSTVVRLLAAILRQSGRNVLAKTTGSKPVLILPDGAEREIARFGRPSILEQKRVLAAAARMGADTVVAEMMSIRAENLRAESVSVFRPGILAITNVRLDHLDDMGRTKVAIAATLAAAAPPGGTTFVLEEEAYPAFAEAAKKRSGTIVRVPKGDAARASASADALPETPDGAAAAAGEFPDNARLAGAIAASLGIPAEAIAAGLAAARPDFGALRLWKAREAGGRALYLASVFAANEPESSAEAIAALRARHPALPSKAVALLNLRADRGDRTEQWLQALEDGFFAPFDSLVFIGDHARALGRRKWARRLGRSVSPAAAGAPRPAVSAIPGRDPARIMTSLAGLAPIAAGEALVVGLGNIGGAGEALVDYWARTGEAIL
jgi:gamma-polyglutamate synthase